MLEQLKKMNPDTRDYLNIDKRRNLSNVEEHSYNCYGYAMGFLEWGELDLDYLFNPYDEYEEHRTDVLQEGIEECNLITFKGIKKTPLNDWFFETQEDCYYYYNTADAVLQILTLMSGLARVVDNIEEKTEEEFIVLFRISDGMSVDWHFVKEEPYGWSHKLGATEIREFEGNPFEEDWSSFHNYDGPIIIFAVNKICL